MFKVSCFYQKVHNYFAMPPHYYTKSVAQNQNIGNYNKMATRLERSTNQMTKIDDVSNAT